MFTKIYFLVPWEQKIAYVSQPALQVGVAMWLTSGQEVIDGRDRCPFQI